MDEISVGTLEEVRVWIWIRPSQTKKRTHGPWVLFPINNLARRGADLKLCYLLALDYERFRRREIPTKLRTVPSIRYADGSGTAAKIVESTLNAAGLEADVLAPAVNVVTNSRSCGPVKGPTALVP
jgi:hypothetical protein